MHRVGSERSFSVRGQRGQALIMVLCLLALVASVVADFQYSSRVDFGPFLQRPG